MAISGYDCDKNIDGILGCWSTEGPCPRCDEKVCTLKMLNTKLKKSHNRSFHLIDCLLYEIVFCLDKRGDYEVTSFSANR